MSAGYATINTVLKIGSTAAGVAKVYPIKTYPALGGSPEQLETTDMEDTMQTFVLGVQSLESMQFTMNYDKTAYESLSGTSLSNQFYQLEFGSSGTDGIYSWKGQHSIFINDGSVNGIREMTLTVSPSTKIYAGAATTIPTGA